MTGQRRESKWVKFHRTSALKINHPNTAGSDLKGDWFRAAQQPDHITINGKPLKEYARIYNGFDTEADVLQFFKEVILKDMTVDSETMEEKVAALKTIFHQGGLLYPVRSHLATGFEAYSAELKCAVPVVSVLTEDAKSTVDIQTTPRGFRVRETAVVTKANLLPTVEYFPEVGQWPFSYAKDAEGKDIHIVGGPRFITSDSSKPYVVAATGELDIDLRGATLKCRILCNKIDFGHAGMAKMFDSRNFWSRLADFLSRVLGMTIVREVTLPETSAKSSAIFPKAVDSTHFAPVTGGEEFSADRSSGVSL